MHKILSIAKYTFIEQVRNRIFYVILVFGLLLLYASVLLGILAVEQEVRVLLDVGLALIELLGLCLSAFGASVLILKEMETKTIYLLLTRPLFRSSYLVGRFLGLVASVWVSLWIMAGLHIPLLLFRGWEFQPIYWLFIFLAGIKIMIISALAVAFSLFCTSIPSALSITGIFWILGHFWQDLKILSEKSATTANTFFFWLMGMFTPNLAIFNLKDIWEAPGLSPGVILLQTIPYSLIYTGACLLIASLLFKRKEF